MTANPETPQVAVLVVCFNGRRVLGDCLRSVLDSEDPGLARRVIVIDNASTDGSAEFVRCNFPDTDLLQLPANRGYGGGANAGWDHVCRAYPRTQYLALLNQDTIVKSGWLAALVAHVQQHRAVAAAQPKLLLWTQKDRFNSAGNQSYFLGFGLVSAYGRIDDGSLDQPHPIDFPSGAALVVRTDAIGPDELFDELFFLYLEDADLGWRLRQLGHRIDYVPAAVVWHQYAFQRDYQFYYFLERNRWYLLATYYKIGTLLLILPALLMMEAGQLYFAWRNKILRQKLRAWAFFLSGKNLARLRRRRRDAQRRRRIGDRAFTRDFLGRIEFPEIHSPLLVRVGNPLLAAYWRIVRPLIFW